MGIGGTSDIMYSDKFAKLWLDMNHDFQEHMAAELAPDLTVVQLHALELILSMEKAKPSDLIAHLEISPAAITTLMDRMEKNKLLIRQRDKNDRRIVWLQITPRGKNEYQRGTDIKHQYFERRLNELSRHNQQVLTYLFGKVAPKPEESRTETD